MFDEEELNRFYRYCIALTGNEEDAFDLLQDSLEKFMRRGTPGLENKTEHFFRLIRNQFIQRALKTIIQKIGASSPCSAAISGHETFPFRAWQAHTRLVNAASMRARSASFSRTS